jgi:hypothetical protein
MYAGKVKRFRRVDIANTNDYPAVHYEVLDGNFTITRSRVQVVSGEISRQWFRPEISDQFMLFNWPAREVDTAKPAWIIES